MVDGIMHQLQKNECASPYPAAGGVPAAPLSSRPTRASRASRTAAKPPALQRAAEWVRRARDASLQRSLCGCDVCAAASDETAAGGTWYGRRSQVEEEAVLPLAHAARSGGVPALQQAPPCFADLYRMRRTLPAVQSPRRSASRRKNSRSGPSCTCALSTASAANADCCCRSALARPASASRSCSLASGAAGIATAWMLGGVLLVGAQAAVGGSRRRQPAASRAPAPAPAALVLPACLCQGGCRGPGAHRRGSVCLQLTVTAGVCWGSLGHQKGRA